MITDKLKAQLGDWTCLYPFFESPEWPKIKEGIRPDIQMITPVVDVWFRAFKECPYADLKVVWLGMSPYFTVDTYTKDRVADGLAFSTKQAHSVPPSLFKLYKGMEWDMWRGMNLAMDRHNELSFLANQGVLLLNAALTTPLGDSKKHLSVWKPFIQYVINVLNKDTEKLVFTGFGTYANELLQNVNRSKHHVEEREHPAASAYSSREWEHGNLFSNTNEVLSKQFNKPTILWDKYLVDATDVPF